MFTQHCFYDIIVFCWSINLIYYEPEVSPFEAIMVDLTHRCNMECANCYVPNRNIPDLNIEKTYQFIEKLPKKTIIRLIGAEPTMREDLSDIIRNVLDRGHRVSLTTNGLKLAQENYVKELKDAGLKYVLLSMNGADNDEVYKIIDNGKYANVKMRALENCFKEGMFVNTGTIVAKDVNEHIISRQYEIMDQMAQKYPTRLKPVLRFRTIMSIGRYMDQQHVYDFDEFYEVVKKELNISDQKTWRGRLPNNITEGMIIDMGNVIVRLVDWQLDDDAIPDKGSELRGRLTPEFKIAPFFDHVKLNEGYY